MREPGEAVLDVVVELNPLWHRPVHFRRYAARLEAAVGGGLRLGFSAPPQNGKSETTLAGLIWVCRTFPHLRHAYITFNMKRAIRVAKKFRRMCKLAGIEVTGTLDSQMLPGGGQVLFSSIDAGIVGEPVDGILLVDDPYSGRKEADSKTRRQDVLDAYREGIETRVHPGGSIIVLATRWHPDDLSSTLINEGWEFINLPAIAEPTEDEPDPNGRQSGEPLFPEKWPLEELLKKRAAVGEFAWAAQYQGRPRPRGGTVFREPTYFEKLPMFYRGSYGVDLAYSEAKKSDWSICLEMWREDLGVDDVTGERRLPRFYVVNVDRKHCEAPEFSDVLHRRYEARKWPMLWRASGVEKGAASFIRRRVPLSVVSPPGDKFISAQEVAAAWNDGRVLVPDRSSPEIKKDPRFSNLENWIDAFLDVVANFTGSGKEHDDDVDALGNAHLALMGGDLGGPPPERRSRPKRERGERARDMAF